MQRIQFFKHGALVITLLKHHDISLKFGALLQISIKLPLEWPMLTTYSELMLSILIVCTNYVMKMSCYIALPGYHTTLQVCMIQ